jgi:AhpD family alkylhydroperoxidase
VALPSADEAAQDVKAVFDEIMVFYATDRVPAVFRWMARDSIFLQGYWDAVREAFAGRKLDRLTKEVLAFAASMTAKSNYGVDLHLREARRLGLSEQGLGEAVTHGAIADPVPVETNVRLNGQPLELR